ncbi:MAG: S41 family peptidase [Candidatus Aminicenantes bacterium]|nr:S41 family peptidase [Candidatus Aminicenantes bacterium]
MRKSLLTLLIVALVLSSFRFSWNDDPWDRSVDKISQMAEIVEKSYFEAADRQELIHSSIRGMLLTLDPHSYFLDPQSYARMREDQSGKYAGLGIQIQKQEDRLIVIAPIEGTPAWRLGIQAGDVISHIEGESTKPLSSFDALQRLRGERGTEVTITLVRESVEEPFDVTIVREEITLYSVPYAFMLDDRTGYVFIRNFAETTAREFQEKMRELAGRGMKRLILDLRYNAGGPLYQSLEISDEFLSRGALIVSIKGRNVHYNREFRAMRDGQYETMPLVVLINEGSASASEIVAGAVMDNDRGYVVGEESFGKGLVQTVYPLGPNTAIALTTAKYLTPSGRSIQKDYSHLEDYFLARDNTSGSREVRYTAGGRKVMGQGGITPDFVVEMTLKPLYLEMRAKGVFFSYARKFAARQTPLAASLFPPGTGAGPDKSFRADRRTVEDFRAYLRALNFDFAENRFEEASAEILRELDRELHASFWNVEEGERVYRLTDPAVLKALEVMPSKPFLEVGQSR